MSAYPKKTITTRITKTKTQSKPTKQHKNHKKLHRKTSKRRSVRTLGSLSRQYLAASMNPFENIPPRLGFGTMMATTVLPAYTRVVTQPYGPATPYAMIVMDPTMAQTTASSLLSVYNATGVGVPMNTPVIQSGAANTSIIGGIGDNARCIAGGVRLRVSNAATNAQPIFYAGLVYDSLTNLKTLNFAQLIDVPTLHPCTSLTNGVESLWRIGDTYDLEFNANALTGWGGNVRPLAVILIAGGGVTVAPFVQIDTVAHLEISPGIQTGLLFAPTDSVSNELSNLEALTPLLGSLGPTGRPINEYVGEMHFHSASQGRGTRSRAVLSTVQEDTEDDSYTRVNHAITTAGAVAGTLGVGTILTGLAASAAGRMLGDPRIGA